MKKIMKSLSLVGIMTVALVGCSTEGSDFSPEQVIQNTLKDSKPIGTYYGEYDMTLSKEKMHVKEWNGKDGKRRIEMWDEEAKQQSISVNDGKNITSYNQAQNKGIVIPITDELKDGTQFSPKAQAEAMLKMVKDTHEISLKGEEKILGRDTYHLVAKEKDEKTLFGNQEIWVDKENWMALKYSMSGVSGGSEIEYTKLDFDAKIPDSIFTIELPKDAEIEKIDSSKKAKTVTTKEMPNVFKKAFLYFPEKDSLKIANVEVMDVVDHKELTINYEKDGVLSFSLSVFPTPKEKVEDVGSLPGEKQTKIRGQKGLVMEEKSFRVISWSEKGYNYSILPINPDLKIKDILKMTKDMKLVK
ncbi:outer membrane lipoprotein carrier protein LolA [Viridibacillus sp. YIM B01967]|uniref:Outer membrane lipoprotein carrier protein LolA n=1 Tax=Viridibacillus soli TaxID=2798301 RepID=A0ABS1H4I4_9BACL|nr:DUF2092 domain-containing protein [Viridibacillus soli]MBK3494219.1 outer membrane lipoprotein carrier protein LolA [Viridibacillus soli]